MAAINNRPIRRIGLNGSKGLNKTSCYIVRALLGVTSLFILHRLLIVSQKCEAD